MKLFEYKGITVYADKLFILMLIFFGLTNVLLQALIMFTVVLAHEMSHIFMARHYKTDINEVTLFPFGGVAKLDFLEVDSYQEIRIAMAGPLTNFFLASIAVAAQYYWSSDYWLPFFIRLNLVMGLFNLLPVLPLDGGRIFRAWHAKKVGIFNATRKAAAQGKTVAVLLVVVSVSGLYLRLWDLNAVTMAAFLFYCAGEQDKTASFHFLRYLLRKKEIVSKDKILNLKTLYTREDTVIKDILPHIIPNNYHLFYIFNHNGQMIKQISEEQLIDAYFRDGDKLPIGKVV